MGSLEERIGKNVKALRGDRSGSNLGEDLAWLLGSPWSRQAVSDAERGRRSFSASELLALADALNTTVPQLYETAEPVTLPSGKQLTPAIVDALTAPTVVEPGRTQQLLAEVRAMRKAQENVATAQAILERAIMRVSNAARGVPTKPIDVTSLGPIGAAVDWKYAQIDERLDEWAGLNQEDGS